ncbi:P-loop containing nucleoside triphosphate hydrolase protein [Gyrodon lividus]|nr:P-loop containing nucleoside triphosphate hydrolase protein [Gyrodon lividus]
MGWRSSLRYKAQVDFPFPCIHIMSDSNVTTDTTSANAISSVKEASAPQEPDLEKTQEAAHHYLKRWQQQSSHPGIFGEWLPLDPTKIKRDAPCVDVENYFYLNIRYLTKSAEPTLVISHFSVTLLDFLRSAIGDQFFDAQPECSLTDFFRKRNTLKTHLEDARTALYSLSGKPLMEKAKELGRTDALAFDKTETNARNYLADVVEHAGVLRSLIEEEFKPIAERLALQLTYSNIAFDLLVYYFEKDARYYSDDGSELTAFTLTEAVYDSDMSSFMIYGKRLCWDGFAYAKEPVNYTILKYPGTKAITDLACKILSDDVRETLAARGKRYAALSGVHYRCCDGRRIVVDRVAYDDRGAYLNTSDEIPQVSEEDLDLLPGKVYGFDIQKKTWESFDVDDIGPVTFDEKAWDHLVLDEDTKALIKGLVNVTKNSVPSKKLMTDVISGKGGGLIAVLHGPPGTGKTLTAEAVAEHLQRPLYNVASWELTTNPESLESNLRNILNLATAWDAVLLIDEADVFLEQRSLHEMERNALVSAALRVLEYHRGVLFLTTNRIHTFDDAFLSRFSIAIKYSELDMAARLTIWRKFFELAGLPLWGSQDEFVALDGKEPRCYISLEDLEELAQKQFNGRTIKNLVRTAQALALSLDEPLSLDHAKVVVRAQEKFLTEFTQSRSTLTQS